MDCEKDAQDLWHTEEKCLAPYSEKGELCEAVVRSIEHQENGISYVVVSFTDLTEKKLPLSELHRLPGSSKVWNTSMFDDEDLEKPSFTDRSPPGPSVDFPLSNTGISIPYTINRYLRDYQRDGAQFLYAHYIKSMGCILGDDMGLGKTIQVISFLAAVLHKKGTREDIENNMPEFLRRTMKKDHSLLPPKKVFLIVSPLSVLFNWKDELETWGYFKVTVIHGNKKDFELSRIKQGKYEIALTTYETLRLCLDELNSIDWAAVIVDEAHRIKNPQARVTHVMKDLNCKVRIGLTGTILQNNMQELWCVMDWAVPGCLGSRKQFKEDFANPVEYGQRHNATKRELATGRKAMKTLASKMAPLFLRRTKALISSQLPEKEDRIVYCSLSEFQKAVYQTVLMTQDVSLVLRGGEKCSCNSGQRRRKCCYKENEHGESVRTLYFSYLAILRKVANHAALLQTDTSTSKKQEAHIKRVCSEVFSKFPEFIQQSKDAAFETISDPKYSGKMMVLQQLLNHSRQNKDKVLLFSFSTKLLDVLERYCMASGLDYRRLDGNTKAEDRLKIVKEFNSTQDVNICLVSTMAGGLGLNFVGANVVVVFDPTWNPANDLQAIDRAYRIGQCRDVKVFRLISLGTVEEMMYLRQVYKQQLHCVVVGSENAKRYFEAVQGSKEHKGELFGVHNLFKLRTRGTCLTRDILEREGKVAAGIMSATMYLSQGPSDTQTDTDSEENIPVTHGKQGQQFQNETFDFSSDSDEEIKERSKLKLLKSPDIADSRRQLTLQQFGFSKMLEKVPQAKSMNPDLSGSSVNNAQNDCNVNKKNALVLLENRKTPVCRRQSKRVTTTEWIISSDSEDDSYTIRKNKHQTEVNTVQETESSSYESDDVIRSSQISSYSETEKLGLGLRHMSEFDNSVPGTSKLQAADSDNISDESDDIQIPNKNMPVPLRQSKQIRTSKDHSCRNSSGLGKDSQTIDSFSSSDDDHLHNKKICLNTRDQRAGDFKGQKPINTKVQRFTRKSSSAVQLKPQKMDVDDGIKGKIVNKNVDSLDGVLDGVEGVAYIHSNQNVVGSSKAENHMSRRAVRDVFELNQFSQLPANITVPVIRKREHSAKEELLLQTKVDASKSDNVLQYPVVYKQRKVCRTSETTFLVGETPKAVRRKQFEEMVSYFNMDSAEEFAQHIISAKSDMRQDMLREFYTNRYNITEDFYPSQAPLAVNVEKEQLQKERDSKNKVNIKRKKGLCLYPNQINKSKTSVTRNVMNPHCTNGTRNDCPTNTSDIDVSSEAIKERSSSKQRPLANSIPYNIDLDASSELVEVNKLPKQSYEKEDISNVTGISTKLLSSTSKLSPENQLGTRVIGKQKVEAGNLTDLLGDTSILDDLFASQTKRQTEVPVRPEYEEPAGKSKHRPKDFWDILNEQNEDSLNKLSDLSVIEKACEVRALSPVNKTDVWNNALWVKNEKFLWRKNDQVQDVNHGYPGKSSDP